MADADTVILDTSNGTGEDVDLNVDPTVDTLPRKEDGSLDEEKIVATNKKLYERTKKAEKDAKTAKETPAPVTPPKPNQAQPATADVDERILRSQGMSEEMLDFVKKVAAVNGTGLIEAQSDPLVVAHKAQLEKEEQSRKAAMPPSRGSGGNAPKKTLATPGLTKEEHKALLRG